jgi:tetratricopeptide (TPR) repeat protein
MRDCLEDDTIAAYVDGTLDLAAIARVDQHIDGCETCRAHLSAVAAVMRSFLDTSETGASNAPTSVAAGSGGRIALDAGAAGPEPGSEFGRYIVEAVIGRGGMGLVARAYDPVLDRRVAIKLVDTAQVGGSRAGGGWRARLRSEAQVMARLRHPNVVAVYDAGSVGELVFVAMELVDGASLARWLAEHGRRDALATCIGAGRGLCAAHAAGIVHGDVKPDNILVDRDGRAMIADFGLAQAIADVDVTAPGDPPRQRRLCGTPAYMAPELLRGERATARTDQFAFAVTVYQALVGHPPWRGETIDQLRAAVGAGPPPRPAEIAPQLWPAIERGLAADPAARHPSLAAFVDALAVYAGRGRRRRLVGAVVAAAAMGAVATVALTAGGSPSRTCADPVDRTAPVAAAAAALCDASAPAGCALAQRALDVGLASWSRAYRTVCTATQQGRQSEALLDTRMRCLDRALAAHAALIERLEPRPLDAPMALRAIGAAEKLPPAAACTTIAGDRGRYTGRTPELDQADGWVSAAMADYALGRYREALAALAPHEATIVAIGYPSLTAATMNILGALQQATGDFAAAEATFDRGLHAAAESGDDLAVAQLLLRLAYVVGEGRQEPARGAELLRAAGAALVRAGNPAPQEAEYLLLRARMAQARGDFAAAVPDVERAVELRRGLGDAGDLAVALDNLCSALGAVGKLEAAKERCEEGVRILLAEVGPDHPVTAEAENSLAIAYANLGDLAGARAHFEAALAGLERSVGASSPSMGVVLLNLAELAGMTGDVAAGKMYLDRGIALSAKDPDDVTNVDLQIRIANLERAGGDAIAAADRLARVARHATGKFGAEHPTTAAVVLHLAEAQLAARRHPDARASFELALATHRALYGERHASTLNLATSYGRALVEMGEPADARPVLEQALDGLAANVAADSPFLADANANLAACMLALRQPARAVELATKALAIREQRGDDPLATATARFRLGAALWRAGRDRPRAVELVRSARDEAKAAEPTAEALAAMERWLAGAR